MTGQRPSDEISESEGAWGSHPRSPEPPCGCVPVRFNTECHCTENCTADCTNPVERCTGDCTIDAIRLVGMRGGSGTSTIAAIMAMHAATMVSTELVSADIAHTSALLGLGVAGDGRREVTDHLVLTNEQQAHGGLTIIDGGTLGSAGDVPESEPGERRIGVLRGPCYLALRRIMAAPHGLDGLIVVTEPGRALNERDVADVTGLGVLATVPATPTIARTIDAGLLARRYRNLTEFRMLRRWLTLQLDPFPTRRPAPRRAAPNHPSMSGTDLPLPPDGERGSIGKVPGEVSVRESLCQRGGQGRHPRAMTRARVASMRRISGGGYAHSLTSHSSSVPGQSLCDDCISSSLHEVVHVSKLELPKKRGDALGENHLG